MSNQRIRITTILAAGVIGVGMLASPVAEAASWDTCNGSPVKWRGTVNLHRNSCSIPNSGIVNSAYWNANGQWDDLSNVIDGFFVNGTGDCSIGHGDGQNEVGLVNRSAIDGNNGLTISFVGLCFIGSNDIDESDVMVANDLNYNVMDGNFRGTAGRSTFVHEFGHFFGFNHENAHAILRPSPPHLLTGDSQPHTLWASDAIGMSSVYGFSTSRPNFTPSALGVVSGSVQRLDSTAIITVCRGNSSNATFYISNAGNVNASFYRLRIRLSTTAPPTGYFQTNNVAASFTHSFNAFSQGTFSLGFTVPSSLPDGIYNVYLDMDSGNDVTELRENDNTTISARRIRVNC